VPYLSASAVVIHYEEALYQVYAPLPTFSRSVIMSVAVSKLGRTQLISVKLVQKSTVTAIDTNTADQLTVSDLKHR